MEGRLDRLGAFLGAHRSKSTTKGAPDALQQEKEMTDQSPFADRKFAITRVYDAPRRLVFDAWTSATFVALDAGFRRNGLTGPSMNLHGSPRLLWMYWLPM